MENVCAMGGMIIVEGLKSTVYVVMLVLISLLFLLCALRKHGKHLHGGTLASS